VTDADPFAVFGLDRSASLVEVRAARRRLAFDLHPDRGGDAAAMQQVNAAFDACVAHLTGRRPLPGPEPAPEPQQRPEPRERPAARGPYGRRPTSRTRWRDLERDLPSFTVNALPAETFEALLVVLSWIGELLDEEPPYLLECHLTEPAPCWCRLDIVPDAGGSTVSLTVARVEGDASPEPVTAEAVRDVWVELLNQLGRPQP
jgi:hypothetical protein